MAHVTFHHIHLKSPDPRAAAKFYEEMFGAKVTITTMPNGFLRVELEIGGMMMLIGDHPPGEATRDIPFLGLEHFGLKVDDIDALAAELKRHGVKFTEEPTLHRPGVKIARIEGPDGVHVELLEFKPA